MREARVERTCTARVRSRMWALKMLTSRMGRTLTGARPVGDGRERDEAGAEEGLDLLRPFGNQLGRHSAIYEFTQRAVCKVRFSSFSFLSVLVHPANSTCSFIQPWVSRENLFDAAVGKTAPPLLDFISRYLGVMRVNYRRARRPSHHSHSQSHCH